MSWTQTTLSVKDAGGVTRQLLAYTDGTNFSIGNTIFDSAGNILGAQGHGTAATALRVELPTDGTGVVGIAAGSQVIGHVVLDSGTITTVSTVTAVTTVSTVTTVGAVTSITNPVTANLAPTTSGGLTPYSYIAAASANQDSQAVKGSAGQLYGYNLTNQSASIRYVKIYNKASGATSSDTPVFRFVLPGNSSGAGCNQSFENGVAFATGICIRITTGQPDNDTGAATAGDVVVNLWYK